MTSIALLLVVVVAAATVYLAVPYLLRAYLRYRGTRTVTCPETHLNAVVEIDAKHAAITSVVAKTELRLADCSRWPSNQNCGQECLIQLEGVPPDCVVRSVLTKWYRGKACVYCAKHFEDVHFYDHKPAVQNAAGILLDWGKVNMRDLDETLVSSMPVCWDCYITQTFKLEHPDLVVYRPWVNGRRVDASQHPHSAQKIAQTTENISEKGVSS